MIVEFDKSFIKSLGKIKDVSVNKRITHIIGEFDQASEIGDIRNVKKLVGFRNYYIIELAIID